VIRFSLSWYGRGLGRTVIRPDANSGPVTKGETEGKAELFKSYPASHVLAYDGVTTAHYLLGGYGIMLGFGFEWYAMLLGLGYMVFAFVQMYLVMPLVVCCNCSYYRLEEGTCVSGNNRISRRIARQGDTKDFGKRAEGRLCHNNLYIASLVLPIGFIVPALILNFSWLLLLVFLAVFGLLLLRFFVIFPKVACVHCMMRARCPNAQQMGLA
jgi:hypothetical protein